MIGNGGILLLPFLFPDGRAIPRWGPWYWLVLYVGMEMIPFVVLPVPAAAQFPLYGIELMLLGGVIAQVIRYRHHSTPLQRLRSKWFLFGYLVFVVFWELNIRLSNALFSTMFAGVPADAQGTAQPIFLVAMSTAQHAAAVSAPIAVLIAVLRWRLFTIDLIIIGRFDGREIDNAGDGFFATFIPIDLHGAPRSRPGTAAAPMAP